MRKPLNVDIFNLGFSFLAYYIVIFSILPIAFALGLTTEFTNLPARGINFLSKESLTYLVTGFFAFLVGYSAMGGQLTLNSLADFLNNPWDPGRSLWVLALVFVSGFAIKCPRILSTLAEANSEVSTTLLSFLSLNPLHFIALAIAFSQYFFLLRNRDKQAKLWRIIAWLLFIFEFLGQVKFGAGRMSILTPVVIYLITRHYLYRRCAGRIILIGLGVFLLIFPLKLYMKDKSNLDENYFTIQQGHSSIETLTSDLAKTATLMIDSSVGRLGQSHIFTAVVNRTEQFLYGQGLLDFFHAFTISSFFNQPSHFINDGNDFGKAIGLLRTHDNVTGVGPTQIGDLYLNFGFSGVIFGMLLMGILYRYLFKSLVVSNSISGIMCYSILWVQIIHGFEDWLSLTFVRHIKVFFVLIVLHILLTTNFTVSAGNRTFVERLITIAKRLWSMGAKPVFISFVSLVLLSTPLAKSMTLSHATKDTRHEVLPTTGVYQTLMRDLEKCEKSNIPFFRQSLPHGHFSFAIMTEQKIRPTIYHRYLLGLVKLEEGHAHEAKTSFLLAANQRHVTAMYNLGMMYEQGYGVAKDDLKAMQWYHKAENHGYVPAIRSLGRLYMKGGSTKKQMKVALKLFSRAASQGDVPSQMWLGYMYQTGSATPQDLTKAVELYRQAVSKDNGQAMVYLAQLYESGYKGSSDTDTILSLYQRAAYLGNVEAMHRLSVLYQSGLIIPKSEGMSLHWKIKADQAAITHVSSEFMKQYYSELTKWAREHVKLNNAVAMRALGILYTEGLSVPKDLSQALEWFAKAGRLHDIPSLRNLGMMYERGLGVEADMHKARTWYQAAASKGDAVASKNIGQLYEREQMANPMNLIQAYNWYNKAANAGNNIAMCKLGKMHYRGESTPHSYEIASQWFKRSAEEGNAAAMNNLGLMHEQGRGVRINYDTAVHWYERSAQNGNFAGMRNLALMYEKGQSLEQDYDQAIHWYRKASRGFDSIARTKLSKL